MSEYDFSAVDALFNEPRDPYASFRSPQQEEEKNDSWQITKGFKAGIDQTQAMGGGFVAAFGDALGVDSLKEWGLSTYEKNMQEAAENQGNVQGFTDIEGFGDAVDWALYTAGNMAPMLATSLASGGVGGIAAQSLAKGAAQRIIGAEVAKGASKEAAKKVAAQHLAKAAAIGASTSAYATNAGLNTGDIYGELPDVENRASTAFAHGAVAGALDTLPVMPLLKRLGVGKAATDQITDSVLKFAGKQMAKEGVTEGLQEIVGQHAQYWIDENKGMFQPEHWKQIIDATAAGALMGGVTGGAAGLLKPSQRIQQAKDEVAEQGGDSLDQALAGNEALAKSFEEESLEFNIDDVQYEDQQASTIQDDFGSLGISDTQAEEIVNRQKQRFEAARLNTEPEYFQRESTRQPITDESRLLEKPADFTFSGPVYGNANTGMEGQPTINGYAIPTLTEHADLDANVPTLDKPVTEGLLGAYYNARKGAPALPAPNAIKLPGPIYGNANTGMEGVPNKAGRMDSDPALRAAEARKAVDRVQFGERYIENQVSDYKKEKVKEARKAKLPKGTSDTRLLKPDYQENLIEASKRFEEAGKRVNTKAVDARKDDLFDAMSKLGGIDKKELSQDGFDLEDMSGVRSGIRPVFSSKGRSVDDMAEALVQDGYLAARDTEELKQKIRNQLSGDPQRSNVFEQNDFEGMLAVAKSMGVQPTQASNAINKALTGKTLTEKQSSIVSSVLDVIEAEKNSPENINFALSVRREKNRLRKALRADKELKRYFDETQAQIPGVDSVDFDASEFDAKENLSQDEQLEAEALIDAMRAGVPESVTDDLAMRYDDSKQLVSAINKAILEQKAYERGQKSNLNGEGEKNATQKSNQSRSQEALQENAGREGELQTDQVERDGSGNGAGRERVSGDAKTQAGTDGQLEDNSEPLLTSYTEKDIQEREAKQAAAQAKEQAEAAQTEAKDKADREADDFQLTGSDRQADSNPNQADLLDSDQATQKSDQLSDKALSKAKVKPSKNTVFTDDAAEKARAILKAKLGQLNSGIDPEIMQAGITLAGYHIEKGSRTFSAYARAMIDDMGESVKPYLKSWYMGVKFDPRAEKFEGMTSAIEVEQTKIEQALSESKGNNDVERTTDSKKPASGANDQSRTEADLFDDGRGQSRPSAIEAGEKASEAQQGASESLGDSSSIATGKSSNKRLHNEKPRVENDNAGSVNDSGSLPDSTGGLFAEQERADTTQRVIESAPTKQVSVKRKPIPRGSIKSGDATQIKERMPFLTEGQVEDVAIAETRFSKDDGYGMMFTNGTGTGKTFTGLGIARRFVDRGKKNILVVAPKQTIADAWIKEGAKFFELEITRLEDVKDKGKGIVVTTYANMGQNNPIVDRDWDLVITDESHYLSSDQEGSSTKSLAKLRALTLKEGSGRDRVFAQNPEKVERMMALRSEANAGRKSDDPRVQAKADEAGKKASKMLDELYAKASAEEDRMQGIHPKDKPRVLFLSATPFAYDKNIVIGQGYLFDWGDDRGGSGSKGYNHADNFQDFMMTHFGYRMRYGKLTQPDAKVDSGLMERAFNAWLKKEGVLSGRMLDSDFDYDRRFVLAESVIGKRVDDALTWLRGYELEDEAPSHAEARTALADIIIGKNFDYHARMYFLEAIKASEALPYIKDYVEAGYKVLVMHDYKKGGTINPFRVTPTPELASIYKEFQGEFSDLIHAFGALPSPISLLSENFPNALVYNGDVTAKKRIGLQKQFNDDSAGAPNLMIAQGDAMREGVSIHDTTGKHKRVLIHLGMPVKPTAAIQQEGRIYRTGQASDAIFRYFTIGSNWERFTFASTISQRAATAENLAMGEMARGLKESFIEAYEEAGTWQVGMPEEGKGGKSKDAALANLLTPWDMAKSYYFGTKKQGSGRASKGREGADYFATPEPLGMKMVEWADMRAGESALEPSAGHGAIGRFFPETTSNKAIEQSDELASRLSLRFSGDVLTGDFEDHNIVNKYDAIVMNPPYGQGGKKAADHVRKAMKHLRDGGRIVALVPTGPAADKQFDKLLHPADPKKDTDSKDIYTVSDITLPRVTFERAGTSVSTRVLVLEKQTDENLVANIRQSNRDYSNAETIEEFFDRIESSEIPARVKPLEVDSSEEPSTGFSETVLESDEEGPGFTTMDSVHSKNGNDLFVVNMSGDMADSYDAYNQLAKKHGGFYIRARMRIYYKPKDGSSAQGKPTFSFDSKEGRDEFLKEASDSLSSVAKFSRNQDASTADARKATAIGETQANDAINRIIKRWKGGRKNIVLVNNFWDLPRSITKHAEKQGAGDGNIRGVFHEGKIYLVRDMLNSVEQLETTLFHEAYGHYGLQELFGQKLIIAMNSLYVSIGGDKGINALAEKYGIDLSRYAKGLEDGRYSAPVRNQIMVEELLSHIAQDNKPSIKRKVKEIIGAIRNWLRRKGFMKLTEYTDSDIMNLLKAARNAAKNSEAVANDDGSPRFMRGNEESVPKFSRASLANEAFDDFDQAQIDAFSKIGPKTLPKQIKERIAELKENIGLKVRQGMVDRFAALRKLDEQARGENVVEEDTANSSWVLSRMSTAASGALNALIGHGRIYMDGGVIDVDTNKQGLVDVLIKLGGSAEVERFMGWIAGNRADKLMAEGKENLFTETDINALKRSNQGTMKDGRNREEIYSQVFEEFQAIQNDVLKIAEESGIISSEAREMWESEFYVPFYRVMQDAEIGGPATVGSGITRQQAFKKLKGGSQNLNDLLENTLMNYEHLISASLKNQAAQKAIENAESVNIAQRVTENSRDKKQSTFIVQDGEKVWYDIADPLVFQAVTAMTNGGFDGHAMKVMRAFKRVFTNFVTASPQFMIANLMRDSFQSVALADMKKNPIANVVKGVNQYGVFDKKKAARAHLQATGGAFSFGHVYGEDAESIKMELNRSLRGAHIIEDGRDALTLLKKGWDTYHGVSDSLENANRAALYDKALKDGKTKLQAAFQSRDLMDFSAHGNWAAMRFLISVVPFLNARVQGLDKIYRAGVKPTTSVIRSMFPGADPASDTDKKAAARFSAVTGALTLATIALYLSNKDDEDYRKLEDWQKDSYWFIKAGNDAYFIPKPFEVGAIATLAERGLEQFVDDTATGELFAERIGHMLSDTFSFNPTPQLFKPMIDLYANKDSFTGRPIESMGHEYLSPSLRTRTNTSEIAKGVSKLTESTIGSIFGKDAALVLSPVQIDYLIGSYLGWVGETATATLDVSIKSMNGEVEPAKKWYEYQPMRRFYKDLSLPGYSKYQSQFYDNLKEVSRIHSDIKQLRELGRIKEAQELALENRDKLRYRTAMNRIRKQLTTLNNRAEVIRRSNMSAEEKRRRLDLILLRKSRLTEMAAKRF